MLELHKLPRILGCIIEDEFYHFLRAKSAYIYVSDIDPSILNIFLFLLNCDVQFDVNEKLSFWKLCMFEVRAYFEPTYTFV